MADYDEFENPVFNHDNNIDDVWPVDDDSLRFRPEVDTTSGDVADVRADDRVPSTHQRLLQTAVDDYYDAMAAQGLYPDVGRDTTQFELDGKGRLRLKDYPNIPIINSQTGKPLALSTVGGKAGGAAAIREGLGFTDWRPKGLPAQAVKSLQKDSRELGEAAGAAETIALQDLPQVAKEVSDTTLRTVTTLTDENVDKYLRETRGVALREVLGLDQALQRIRGELVNNLAKLSGLDHDIERIKKNLALERRKLSETSDKDLQKRIADLEKELSDKQQEREARLEAASASREALRSQINRVRETIRRILHEDTTLAERIRTLFREQGITIVSILTAIGMAIGALVFALTGSGGGAAPTPPQPPSKGGVKEWLKKHLQSLGRLLAKLAGKAAAALPGVIGSIVSWVLGLLAKTTSWLATNLWAVVVAVGGLLLVAAREWLSKKPKHH